MDRVYRVSRLLAGLHGRGERTATGTLFGSTTETPEALPVTRPRRRHGLTPQRKKWRMLRISWKTHDMLKDMKKHSNVPMLEFVEAVVTHIYGGGVVSMQALTFFMMYFDGKPTFVVAAKSAEAAET